LFPSLVIRFDLQRFFSTDKVVAKLDICPLFSASYTCYENPESSCRGDLIAMLEESALYAAG